VDLCDKKVPWGSLTMMKDVSLMKKGAVGENLFYKVQDFVYDDVLFEYCRHPTVNI
jgi:phytanoyl-CoA hydroxylase